ncbi:hypothetical protein [Marinobacter pelagius]|uniref:Uncharacterized protein n=1 Tax=Marinobacter pelagius TaxID=379482 RepID=A0A1I4T7C8_9GAMM|nr:hypothetical protein [Marinobacter pelagius]SFM72477.1 hypothetical protein SAMN04487961_1028 [Marinobacter pelagius]
MKNRITDKRRKEGDALEREQMQANLERDYGRNRPTPQDQKENLADLILKQRDQNEELRQQLEQAQAREVELLTICQSIQRDLLLRAEPDWDGSGRQVVNLSAGFWDELNRVIGKYDDSASKSFDAMILRQKAEVLRASVDLLHKNPYARMASPHLLREADRLDMEARELDAKQAGGNQCQ